MEDVQRLRLIKRLTLAGHAIGTVAGLDAEALARLASGSASSAATAERLVLVGAAVAQKLEGRLRPSSATVFGDLAEAEGGVAGCGAADVLVVHVASLHAAECDRVLALRADLPAAAVVVVYAFGAEAAADRLRSAGVTVRREPVSGNELAKLVVASRSTRAPDASDVRTSPRRYSDAELAAIADTPSRVACECPRHLAEIVTLLASFEQYSAGCASRNRKDAELHRHLHEVTSTARTMFEQALVRVVVDEGIAV